MLSPRRIDLARDAIDPVFLDSPQRVSRGLGLGAVTVLLKIETENPIGSFKGRGASWWLHGRTPEPVVCASAGNFGQGLAYAAKRRGAVAEVFAAETANPSKLAAMESLGARVHLHGRDFDEAKARAVEYAAEHGLGYVEDGDADEIAEGAGTIALELLRYPGRLAAVYVPVGNGALINGVGSLLRARSPGTRVVAVYVPVGNGALINGVGSILRARSPATRVIGVCAGGAPCMERSWRSGVATSTELADTIADGIATRVPVPRALEHLVGVVDDMVLVSDDQMIEAMRRLWRVEGIVAEPAGAASLAGALADPARPPCGTVAVIISGSNLDPRRRSEWLPDVAGSSQP